MATQHPKAEPALLGDLEKLAGKVAEDWFAVDLYRALAQRRWHRQENSAEVVSFSWRRAEQIVNSLREKQHAPKLDLDASGGEGQLSDDVDRALRALGWVSEPMSPDEHDPAHVGAEPPPPPPPDPGPTDWEREAHRAAHEERLRKA
jgi:hypothetical protein